MHAKQALRPVLGAYVPLEQPIHATLAADGANVPLPHDTQSPDDARVPAGQGVQVLLPGGAA
jgi:hypothetical protein